MPKFVKTITFEAKDQAESEQVMIAISSLLNKIQEKKYLIELGQKIEKNPGLIQKAIPMLKYL